MDKKSKYEIRFAGFGGQGIVLCGYIIGKAASIYDKKNAVFTQSYGPEARGGSCSANIVISDKKVNFPKVQNPDIAVLMSEDAYHTFGKKIKEDAVVILDEDMIRKTENLGKDVTVYNIPATKIAEDLGNKIMANIVMIGYFIAKTNVVSYNAVKEAILSSVPRGTEDLNLMAFEKGYNYNGG